MKNLLIIRGGQFLYMLFIIIFLHHTSVYAQDGNLSIEQQFEETVKKSGTFKEYKVIKITKLNELFASIKDTLKSSRGNVAELNAKITTQQAAIENLTGEITQLTTDLETSNFLNNEISFLGISFQKATYNVLVWGIIFVLVAGLIFVYLMFKRSHIVTRNTQKELSEVMAEFEAHKNKSQERHIKLKRELQTAINTINEKGIRV